MYFNEYNQLPDSKTKKSKYDPDNFFLKHNYDNWLENEKESTDTEESTDKQNR